MFPVEILLNIGIYCDEKTMYNLFHTTPTYIPWFKVCQRLKRNFIRNRIKGLEKEFSKNHFLEDKFKSTWLRKVNIPSYNFDLWEDSINRIESMRSTHDEFRVILSCFRYRSRFRLDNFSF